MNEFVLYRWDTEHRGAMYFVVGAEDWKSHVRHYADGKCERVEVARGTYVEMKRLLRLVKEDE